MKTLHRFVLKTFFGPFILNFALVMFILLMQFLWKWVDALVGKGLEWTVIAELIFYIAVGLMPLALPLAMLLSTLMAMGNMGENNETLALKAAGVSLIQIMAPIFYAGTIITIGAFFLSNNVVPYTNLKAYSLLFDVQQKRPELQIKEGVFYNGIPGFSLKIGEKEEKTNLLKRLIIYNHSSGMGNTEVTIADSGYMKVTSDQRYLIVTLYSGNIYQDVPDNTSPNAYELKPFRSTSFTRQQVTVPLDNLKFDRNSESLLKDNERMQNIGQLKLMKDTTAIKRDGLVRSFVLNIIHSGYFRKSRELDSTLKEKDLAKFKSFKFDSVYKSFDTENRLRVVEAALSSAKSTQMSVVSNSFELSGLTERINRIDVERHKKFTLSLAALLFFFIGAPLGAIIRKGGFGMPIVVSVLFFIVYYIISITGEKFAREGVWSIVAGTWFSTFVLLAAGIFLSYKATHESQIMSKDAYTNFIKRIFKRKK